jgi:hypothetical protein
MEVMEPLTVVQAVVVLAAMVKTLVHEVAIPEAMVDLVSQQHS